MAGQPKFAASLRIYPKALYSPKSRTRKPTLPRESCDNCPRVGRKRTGLSLHVATCLIGTNAVLVEKSAKPGDF